MQASELTIRRIDPAQDGERVLSVLRRNLPEAATRARLDWLYLSNPDGPSLVWVAEDAAGNPIGTSAAHPRRMRIRGEVVLALNLSDFAIDAPYRSLGPALRLLRATLEPIRRGEFAFGYDFGSESMRAIYRRMGGIDLGPTERWVRPVRLRGLAKRKLGNGLVGAAAGAVGDAAVRVRDALLRVPHGIEVESLEGECGSEFDALDERLSRVRPVAGVRDAAYLNWKHLRHAMWAHTLVCARRSQRLVGFVVLRAAPGANLALTDLFAEDDDQARRGLLARVVAIARERGAEMIQAQAVAGGAYASLLRELGFVPREQGPGPVPIAPSGDPARATLESPDSWWLTEGDRDI
jgi:hypothetical protein